MHLLAEESIEIRCPVAAVYGYACDLEQFGQWFPGVVKIVAENALDITATEKSYLETGAIPLRGHRTVQIRVKEAQRDKIFITEGSLRPLLPRMQIQFRDAGSNATWVNWQMHSRSQSAFLRATLIPLAKRVMTGRARQGLANLKRHLEHKRSDV